MIFPKYGLKNLVFQIARKCNLRSQCLWILAVVFGWKLQSHYSHSVISKIFEKIVNKRPVDQLGKCSLFFWFPIWFHVLPFSCRSFDTCNWYNCCALEKVWDYSSCSTRYLQGYWGVLLHKLKSYGTSPQVFSLIPSFLGNRQLRAVWHGKLSQRIRNKTGVLQGAILGPTLLLLCINDPFDVIYDISTMILYLYWYLSALNVTKFLIFGNSLSWVLNLNLALAILWIGGRKWSLNLNAGKKPSCLNHLFPMHPFSIPWKYQKTLRFSDVFRR